MIRLACFDLDGTLITGTTTTLFLAKNLGFDKWSPKFEEDFRTGLYNNSTQIAQETARQFRGVSLGRIYELYPGVPKIANITSTVANLKKRGIIVILASITWGFFVELFANEYGFDSYCGTQMNMDNNVLTGEIGAYCNELDKLQFFLNPCRHYGVPLRETISVGDSKSDHPIFREAGKSIALNADPETKRLATYSLDTKDLLDILPFFD